MPNHCINELIFRDVDAGMQARIRDHILNEEGRIDFGVLLPKPLNVWWGSASDLHGRVFKRTALDWCAEHWGTKWNAYDIEPTVSTDDTLTLRFQTAWNPPYPWLVAVFNKLAVSFDHNSLTEGTDRGRHGFFYAGYVDPTKREAWTETDADDVLHRHLRKLLFGVEEFEDDDQ